MIFSTVSWRPQYIYMLRLLPNPLSLPSLSITQLADPLTCCFWHYVESENDCLSRDQLEKRLVKDRMQSQRQCLQSSLSCNLSLKDSQRSFEDALVSERKCTSFLKDVW
jgi:hypothetical protein